MKKRIALIMLAVVLALVLVGGSVYGIGGHGKERGEKIIGHGMVGTLTTEEVDETYYSMVWFSNSDCYNDVEIKRVIITRMDGTLIYEGPYVMMPAPGAGDYEIVNIIKPHELRVFVLNRYMWTGAGDPTDPTDPNNWMSEEEALALPWADYTVEIFWEPASKRGATCPLTGWMTSRVVQYQPGGTNFIFYADMKNMTQR